jgi:site-specific DNA-methyltransferase (adenine-specific)
MLNLSDNNIILGDNLEILPKIPPKSVSLIYIDPPFNTGRTQKRKRTDKGKILEQSSERSYKDKFEDYEEFLMERIKLAIPSLKDNGSLFVHLDYNEVHYIKVAIDKLLGRDHFMNEIIYSWDYGARNKNKWSCKHNTILWYVMDPKDYIFNFEDMDRIPYKAPELIRNTAKNAEEKIKRGKTPTTVWELGIVHTMSKESEKYPTQKPLSLLNRIIKVHSNLDDVILDFFAGSGTTVVSAALLGRKYLGIDINPSAIDVINKRISALDI